MMPDRLVFVTGFPRLPCRGVKVDFDGLLMQRLRLKGCSLLYTSHGGVATLYLTCEVVKQVIFAAIVLLAASAAAQPFQPGTGFAPAGKFFNTHFTHRCPESFMSCITRCEVPMQLMAHTCTYGTPLYAVPLSQVF